MYDSDIRKEKYFEMGKREKRTADPDYHCIYGDSTDVVVRVHPVSYTHLTLPTTSRV